MQQRELGKSGLQVSMMGLGCMELSSRPERRYASADHLGLAFGTEALHRPVE